MLNLFTLCYNNVYANMLGTLILKELLNDCCLYLNNAKEMIKTENFSFSFRIFST